MGKAFPQNSHSNVGDEQRNKAQTGTRPGTYDVEETGMPESHREEGLRQSMLSIAVHTCNPST